LRALSAATVLAAVAAGCAIPSRGRDFGSIATITEPVPLTSLYRQEDAEPLATTDRVLVLPLFGDVEKKTLKSLRAILGEEARKYLPCTVLHVAPEGRMADYVAAENLRHVDGRFNSEEIARLGRYMAASHILAAHLRETRFYPPQNLEIALIVVEAENAQPVAEIRAGFCASEQRVIAALGRHLDRRLARPYDRISLDFMLRSPTEYGRFALAECCRTLATELWEESGLRRAVGLPIVHSGI